MVLPSHHAHLEAGGMRFVDCEVSPHCASRMWWMRIKRAPSRTCWCWEIMMSCAEAASVDFQEALRHRRDSSPSDEAIGGLFFDFGPIRTTRSPRREHSRERESNLDVVASTASARRPATPRRRRHARESPRVSRVRCRRHAALDRYVESNMTDSKELVELAKRGGLEMTQGSSVGTSPASARLRGDSVASVGLEFEHLMDLDAGLSGVPVVFDGPSPRRRTGSAGSASDGLGPAFAMDFEDPEGAAPASRRVVVVSLH